MTDFVLKDKITFPLPERVACLTFPGTVLLPQGVLPLTITKPHHIKMIDDALKKDRLLGIVQTSESSKNPEDYFRSGCLGKIITFHESESQQGYFVVLKGVSRFLITEEIKAMGDARLFDVRYDTYSAENEAGPEMLKEQRDRLLPLLRQYFSMHNLSPNWDEISNTSDDKLVTSLAMLCPFEPQEKQALLETPTLQERYEMLTAILEISFNKEAGKHVQH